MSEAASDRTRLHRLPERGHYDRGVINAILDEALICHIGFVHEGAPVVIPTIHARVGDTLYFHGSPASRMLRSLGLEDQVCVNVSLIDGVVVARAAFHNSLNYRSVVVFGVPRIVDDADEKLAALAAVTNHVIPGRWADSRPMTDKERNGTLVAALPLTEASAKVRVGGPKDDDGDYDLPIWAGVIPLTVAAGHPVPDPGMRANVEVPGYVGDYRRPGTPEV
ncbi:MAG: pyridoxamine 5'-phosphate oxidase family protein [Acidimicrobiia bacterium]